MKCVGVAREEHASSILAIPLRCRTGVEPTDLTEMWSRTAEEFDNPAPNVDANGVESRKMAASGKHRSHGFQLVCLYGSLDEMGQYLLQGSLEALREPSCPAKPAGLLDEGGCSDGR